MGNVRSISSSKNPDPFASEPLGLKREDYSNLYGTPEHEERLRAFEELWKIRAAANSVLVDDWANEEADRLDQGKELNLEGLYHQLQSEDPELSDKLEEKVLSYREMVSALTTYVQSTTVAKKPDVGFGDEEDLLRTA